MPIFVNDQPIYTFNYASGECYVRVDGIERLATQNTTTIIAKLYNADAIIQLAMTIEAIRSIKPNIKINLIIPYLPYSRQDKINIAGEAHGAQVIANLINNLGCNCVTIYDPHSKTIPELLNACRVITLEEIISMSSLAVKILEEDLLLVSPDYGAKEKVTELANKLGVKAVYANKIKDHKGDITFSSISRDVNGKDCIILDDICDSAKTAIAMSKLLRGAGSKNIYLYITHGIFSNGLMALAKYFTHVYCYHTMLEKEKIDVGFLTIFEKEVCPC